MTVSEIHQALAAQVANYAATTQRYVFPAEPRPGHVWDDARQVFQKACADFASALPAGETPLLFVGAHTRARLTGRRRSFGFLLTDRAWLVLRPSLLAESEPLLFPLTGRASADQAAAAFDWTDFKGFTQHDQLTLGDFRARLTQVLSDAAAVVWSAVSAGGAPAPARRTAADIPGRLRELGLTDTVKLGRDPKQAKHLGKLAKKLGLPAADQIVVAISNATLAGPYGTVVTAAEVRSRDLLEDPVPPTPRTGVDPSQVVVEGERLILGPGQVHTLPSSLPDTARASLQTFLRELLAGALA
ncbi:MAG: hypothetical protein LBK42_04705 [Propionibacteriaceae bacterium]|jgi:hypothetical protein|nr:hypothetical protein [Propionibacteriaceae bacterium]